jgi:DNA-directed RNA polymerase subunit E"
MPKELACKKCKAITYGKICAVCKSTELSPDWSGIILVFEPLNSKNCCGIEYQRGTQIRTESRIII